MTAPQCDPVPTSVSSPAPRKRRWRAVCLVAGLAVLLGLWLGAKGYRWWLEGQISTGPPQRDAKNAPYIPSPQDVVDRMLELADLDASDVVYDLGCGDGRIVITAAKRYGCRGIGFEYDPQIAELARENAKAAGVADLVTIEERDIFTIEPAELNRASVITLYLLPWMNEKLQPRLAQLEAGKRIVSHEWDLPGATPDHEEEMESRDDDEARHRILTWTTPLSRPGPISTSHPPQD
ncbi:MAG TPA: class I SAM-dependent methyltransferase [Pirellulaceae bacterium]|nr:class I SAM-dependent methyltransferase [Pirellulaceae bacterium]